jgi:hypothetical protein
VVVSDIMATNNSSPDYQVDGRVSIAMDALDDRERLAVAQVINDRDNFLASTADRRKVRKISKTEPIYALNGPDGLRIIYSKVGDRILVLDLMHQLTLDRYARAEPSKAKKNGTTKVRSQTLTKKAK